MVSPCCVALGLRSWTPTQRLLKVDCAGDSTASDVVVVAVLIGHLGGEEQAAGFLGVDGGTGFSQIAFLRPGPGQWAVLDIMRARRVFFGRKLARCFAYGCRYPLGGAVVVTLAALGLRVKTLDLAVLTMAAYSSLPS
jgi:hypothetical protein